MSIIVAFVCFIVIVFLVKVNVEKKNQRLYYLLRQFPSHPTYPIIGNVHSSIGPFKKFFEKAKKILQPYDRQVYWIGPIPLILLKKYDDITIVMNQCQERGVLELFIEFLGVGLLSAKYKEWKTSRRILNPAFSSEMLSKYFQVFQKNAENLTENLKSVADTDEEVDVLYWMTKISLDSIVENSIGVSIQDSGKSGEKFGHALHVSTEMLANRLASPWLLQRHVFAFYVKITGKIRFIEELQSLPSKMVKNTLENLRKLRNIGGKSDTGNSSKAIIDLIVDKCLSETDFTETRAKDELLQIIASGTETLALTLSFLLLMLALNQDVQQKLFEEINQYTTNDNVLTENDLCIKFPYLDQCIKETLRRYSPVVVTARRTHKEILLKDKTIIPANVFVAACIYITNQDPDLYENPSKWDPEHFNQLAVEQRPKASQISFSCGPRNCIGARYAMMMAKTQIIYILRKYHLSTNIKELTENDLYTDLSIRSKLGYPVKFTSRS